MVKETNENIITNINNILENLEEMGIYNYDSKDLNQISDNINILSYLMLKIISILKHPNLSYDEKKDYLLGIKLDNNTIFDNETVNIILENEKNYISMFNIFIKFSKSDFYKQNGGYVDDDDDTVFKKTPILNKIPDNLLFPLDAIEDTIPITQLLFGWLLFFSTIIGFFTKLSAPYVATIMKFGSDMFWTIIGAIPLFGFDPLVSALSVPMKYGFNLFVEFIVGLIEASPNIYKFIIQLSRKNFGDALKEFSKTTLIFTQLYNLLDRALPLLNNNLMFLLEYMPIIIKYAEPFASIFLKTIAGFNNILTNFIQK